MFCLQEAVADGGHSAQQKQKGPLKRSQKRSQKAAQRPPAGSHTPAIDPVLDWIFNAYQPYHAKDKGVPGKEHLLLLRLPLFSAVVAKERWFAAACKHLCARRSTLAQLHAMADRVLLH